MTDHPREEPFDDVNDAVEAEWTAETTPFDRVQTVSKRLYEPTSAAAVAERALTTPKTARKHLDSLVDSGFLTTDTGDAGATLYSRSAESIVTEQVRDILGEMGTAELAERILELEQELDEYREQFGADSPESLAVAFEPPSLEAGEPTSADELDLDDVRAWRTTRRNLAFAKAALAVARAQDVATDVPTAEP